MGGTSIWAARIAVCACLLRFLLLGIPGKLFCVTLKCNVSGLPNVSSANYLPSFKKL